jgi:hypothetical protein
MYVWPNVKWNVINNASNGIYGPLGINGGEVGYNRITNINQSFDGTVHENCIEILIGVGNNGTFYIHDNFLQNCDWRDDHAGQYRGDGLRLEQHSDRQHGKYDSACRRIAIRVFRCTFGTTHSFRGTGLNCFLIGSRSHGRGSCRSENNHCITSASGGAYSGLATTAFSAAGGVTVATTLSKRQRWQVGRATRPANLRLFTGAGMHQLNVLNGWSRRESDLFMAQWLHVERYDLCLLRTDSRRCGGVRLPGAAVEREVLVGRRCVSVERELSESSDGTFSCRPVVLAESIIPRGHISAGQQVLTLHIERNRRY